MAPGSVLPAAAFEIELEGQELEEVSQGDDAEKLVAASDEKAVPASALHLHHRVQRIGLGWDHIVVRTGLHDLRDGAPIPLLRSDVSDLRGADTTEELTVAHHRK